MISTSKLQFWCFLNILVFASVQATKLSNPGFTSAEWWIVLEPVATSLLAGGLVSFLFYFLVVYLPERRRRLMIKSNLKKLYGEIKRDIAYQIVFASRKGGREDLEPNKETIETLLTIHGFVSAFNSGSEGNEGFYAFQNYIGDDVPEYREITLSLRMLAKQIDFILHNYPISDPKAFNFFKRLELYLLRIQAIGPGYEEEKELSRFIWQIFGGWNWTEGQRSYDIVDKMIGDI